MNVSLVTLVLVYILGVAWTSRELFEGTMRGRGVMSLALVWPVTLVYIAFAHLVTNI